MDISSKSGYPASELSNFTAHSFLFDGVECASMEGLLQAFKFEGLAAQVQVCQLSGMLAKKKGQERNDIWKREQKLWWQGVEYDRHGKEYQELLDRAYNQLARSCASFREALISTGSAELTHKVGNADPQETVLTEAEFCSRLMKIRTFLQQDVCP